MTQSTAGGEDIVEFVDFKIASLLFACCRNPDNGGMDGLLMDFAIYARGHDHLIISMRFQLFPSGIILTNFILFIFLNLSIQTEMNMCLII